MATVVPFGVRFGCCSPPIWNIHVVGNGSSEPTCGVCSLDQVPNWAHFGVKLRLASHGRNPRATHKRLTEALQRVTAGAGSSTCPTSAQRPCSSRCNPPWRACSAPVWPPAANCPGQELQRQGRWRSSHTIPAAVSSLIRISVCLLFWEHSFPTCCPSHPLPRLCGGTGGGCK